MSFPKAFYRWRPHPWHGLDVGPKPPSVVHAYIEITPFDLVKYEIDKETGYLRVDRPNRTSSVPPTLYGFIPRTFCGDRVGALMPEANGGDKDPLDICVLSERPINRSEVILNARIVGGIPMLDDGEADDKIIAVLDNDKVLESIQDLSDLSPTLTDRLRHYFSTYKVMPGEDSQVSLGDLYDKDRAIQVIRAAMADYDQVYGT